MLVSGGIRINTFVRTSLGKLSVLCGSCRQQSSFTPYRALKIYLQLHPIPIQAQSKGHWIDHRLKIQTKEMNTQTDGGQTDRHKLHIRYFLTLWWIFDKTFKLHMHFLLYLFSDCLLFCSRNMVTVLRGTNWRPTFYCYNWPVSETRITH